MKRREPCYREVTGLALYLHTNPYARRRVGGRGETLTGYSLASRHARGYFFLRFSFFSISN